MKKAPTCSDGPLKSAKLQLTYSPRLCGKCIFSGGLFIAMCQAIHGGIDGLQACLVAAAIRVVLHGKAAVLALDGGPVHRIL